MINGDPSKTDFPTASMLSYQIECLRIAQRLVKREYNIWKGIINMAFGFVIQTMHKVQQTL